VPAGEEDGLASVARFPQHLEVVLALEEQPEAGPHHRVIVDDQDTDHVGISIAMVVP